MRLHAMIFAASVQTPAVGLAYDPKVASFCRRSGHPVLQLQEITPERLSQALDQALAARDDDHATTRLVDLKQAAELNFDAGPAEAVRARP